MAAQRDSSGQREAARAAGNAAWQRMLRIAAAVSRIVGHDMPAALQPAAAKQPMAGERRAW
jgi:hypothetical protein